MNSQEEAEQVQAGIEAVEVVTRMRIAAPTDAVWRALVFYEQIEQRPPLLLRLLLPVPIGTEGAKHAVGDEALCHYEGGHLRKRVTAIRPGSYYGFDVAEQRLVIGGGLELSAGSYTLRALPGDHTELAVMTRYRARGRLRRLLRPVETAVCHMFHRHLLRAIRGRALNAGGG